MYRIFPYTVLASVFELAVPIFTYTICMSMLITVWEQRLILESRCYTNVLLSIKTFQLFRLSFFTVNNQYYRYLRHDAFKDICLFWFIKGTLLILKAEIDEKKPIADYEFNFISCKVKSYSRNSSVFYPENIFNSR